MIILKVPFDLKTKILNHQIDCPDIILIPDNFYNEKSRQFFIELKKLN